jgi:multidrug resistance efflux pump
MRLVGEDKVAKCIVLWTSDRHAIIVSITDGVEEILHVESKANRRVERRRRHPLSEHYRKVIHAILDAQSIFIFGPARAKMELASATWNRYKPLMDHGAVSRQDGDQQLAAFRSASAAVDSVQARIGSADQNVQASRVRNGLEEIGFHPN